MSIHMRCSRLNLLKKCHRRGVPYATLAEIQNNIGLPLDDFNTDRLASCQDASNNTYSVLNKLVLKADCGGAKTCNTEPHRRKTCLRSINPIENALSARDFDFLLRLGKGIQPVRQYICDNDTLNSNKRRPTAENRVGVVSNGALTSHGTSVRSRTDPPWVLHNSLAAIPSAAEIPVSQSSPDDILNDEGQKKKVPDDKRTGPTQEQLDRVKEYYIYITPKIINSGEEFTAGLHHKDMVFENNYYKKPKTVQGIGKYSWELTKLRLYANLRFTHFGFEPRSVTTHIDEHSVIVYWRLYYQNQLKFFQFWKFNPFKPAEEKFDWVEGFSTFYLNKNGVIIKHKVDRTVPIQVKKKKSILNWVGPLGLAPTSNFWDSL